MTTDDPIAVVEALVAAFNRLDAAAVAALLHDDIVCVGGTLPAAIGKAATLDLLAPFLAADAVDWRVTAIAANRRTVLTERVDRFRFGGGDWVAVPAAGVFEIAADGRIIAWRDYFDMVQLQAALG